MSATSYLSINSYDEILQDLFNRYYEVYPDMPKIKINIVISDSLSKSNIELRPDLKEELISNGLESLDNNNGLMVCPMEIQDPLNILLNSHNISKYTADGSMTWIGTFAHELTHAIDFHQMAIKENLDSYNSLLKVKDYYMFHLWTEFHARKFGYAFLRKMLNVDNDINTKKERINYIKNQEWPMHITSHFNEYHKTNNGNIQMNSVMQLLGRYSVWCDLFPEEFNNISLKQDYINTPWVSKVFDFLQQYSSLEKIYPKFGEMRLILKENWKSL